MKFLIRKFDENFFNETFLMKNIDKNFLMRNVNEKLFNETFLIKIF